MSQIKLEVDLVAGAAYVRLSSAAIHHTVEATEDVLIDLDELNIVVGIEVLRLSAEIPFGRLVDDFHVHTDVVDLLRQIQPSVAGFLELTHASEGATDSVHGTTAAPA